MAGQTSVWFRGLLLVVSASVGLRLHLHLHLLHSSQHCLRRRCCEVRRIFSADAGVFQTPFLQSLLFLRRPCLWSKECRRQLHEGGCPTTDLSWRLWSGDFVPSRAGKVLGVEFTKTLWEIVFWISAVESSSGTSLLPCVV